MADIKNNQADAAAEAPAKVAAAVADTAEKVVKETAQVAKRERAKTARRTKRQAKATTARKTTARKSGARKATATRTAANTTRATGARKAAAGRNERIDTVNFQNNPAFAAFTSAPVAAPFQTLFAEAGERGQDVARRSQKAAEELADLTRENVEALAESGRIAAEGARSLGQDLVSSTRTGVEQAADAVRALAEAKSPTEFVQLQGEFARASFDRMVAQSSRLTETFVKLAGEAFQPISNRSSVAAERFNRFVA